jgi:hypothetical protein
MQAKSPMCLTIPLLLCLFLSACASEISPTATNPPAPPAASTLPPVASPTTTPTATAEIAGIGGGGSSEEQTTPSTEVMQVTLETRPEGTEASSCLIGTWSVVHESLVGYLTEVFDQSGLITFEFQTGQGDLFLTFDGEGSTSFIADDLVILVAIPELAEFKFLVQGDGLAQYAADEGSIATWGHVSALTSEGGGDISGQTTDAAALVVLTPEQIFLDSTGEHATFTWIDVPEDARFTFYTCHDNNLSLNVDGTLTSEWTRVKRD